MKNAKYLTILFFLLTACQRDPPNESKPNTPSIVGQWEWFKSVGSLTPLINPQNSGLTWQLKFNSDSTCVQTGSRFPNGTAAYSLKGYTFASIVSFSPGSLYCTLLPIPYYRYFLKSTDTLMIVNIITYSGQEGPFDYFVRK